MDIADAGYGRTLVADLARITKRIRKHQRADTTWSKEQVRILRMSWMESYEKLKALLNKSKIAAAETDRTATSADVEEAKETDRALDAQLKRLLEKMRAMKSIAASQILVS